jgi:hypothetical protein
MGYDAIAMAICGAILYTRVAAAERSSPWIWGALSVGCSGVAMFGLGLGWLGVLAGQVILFILITVYRTVTDKDDGA